MRGKRNVIEPGSKFHKFTVLEELPPKAKQRRFRAVCECGNTTVVWMTHLLGSGDGCGCTRRELALANINNKIKKPKGEAALNHLFGDYRRSATNRGISWNLTKEQFAALTKQPCVYCGSPPSAIANHAKRLNGSYLYNGIDRIENTGGYDESNVAPCCVHCNYAKRKLSVAEFFNWVSKVYKHMSELNQHIDRVAPFQQPPSQDAPIVDQSANMNFALGLAQRQAAAVAQTPAPEPQRPLGHMPIPN